MACNVQPGPDVLSWERIECMEPPPPSPPPPPGLLIHRPHRTHHPRVFHNMHAHWLDSDVGRKQPLWSTSAPSTGPGSKPSRVRGPWEALTSWTCYTEPKPWSPFFFFKINYVFVSLFIARFSVQTMDREVKGSVPSGACVLLGSLLSCPYSNLYYKYARNRTGMFHVSATLAFL